MKECSRCGKRFRVTYAGIGGMQGYCPTCRRAYGRNWSRANPRLTQMRLAVCLYRKFRFEPDFHARIQKADERAAVRMAARSES